MSMNKSILVASILTPEDNETWGKNLTKIFESLDYENKEAGFLVSKEKPIGHSKYSTHCIARNKCIEKFLKPHHDYVFWIDPDVVSWYSNDIVSRLLEIDSENIIAPYVFIEPHETNPWKYERFFDIDFFLDENGNKYRDRYPYHDTVKMDNKYECRSVGTCVLVPARVHRRVKFDHLDPRGDWVSLCQGAKEINVKTYSTDEVILTHAFLPLYGKQFK